MPWQPEGLGLEIFQSRHAFHPEETWGDACKRVAWHVANAEQGTDRERYAQEFLDVLLENLFMPGGRTWYGAGRAKGQLLNCFVIGTEDSREGWGQTVSDSIVISGTGGGVGLNCSPIRPRGTPVKGTGGTATGAVSLMEIINAAGEVIKAGGGRRTALMLCLDIRHPDILEFLDAKLDLGRLNNANVSVVFSDDPERFFEAVREGTTYDLVHGGRVVGQADARQVWAKVVENALRGGEPGILNMHLANRMSNIWYGRRLISTNPCITGDTKIAVADGRNAVPIEQLAREGRDIPVYSTDPNTGQVQVKMGRNPRLTGVKSEVWRLTLDDGSVLRATPNHKILLKDLRYVELKDLKEGDSVFPFNSFGSNGYRQVCNTGAKLRGWGFRNRRQYRLIHEFYNGPVDSKEFAIHHVDFDGLNDCIDNLKVLTHEEHTRLHSSKMMGTGNPYHRMDDEWKFRFASHPGKSNPRHIDVSNEMLVEHGRKLLQEHGDLTSLMWTRYAKENGLPQFLANKFRFGTFQSFRNQVIGNHRVVSVEFDGYEDVYNITVDDNHNYHVVTSSEDGQSVTSSGLCVKNCGEIWLSEAECCCLGAVVLPRFVTPTGKVRWELLRSTVRTGVRFLDDVLTVNNYPLPKIARTCQDLRRIGLGVMGLHDFLLLQDLDYSSPEGLEMTDRVMRFIKEESYAASVDLAVEKGPFPLFQSEGVARSGFIKSLRPTLRQRIEREGLRNCAVNTIAPTGTTSMVAGVTSGVEPMFAPAYRRRWRVGDELAEEVVVHPLLRRFVTEGRSVTHFRGAYDISLREGFEVQRACQRHVDNAISKTLQVRSGTSREELSELYMEYLPELKGVTVYPEGSREDQPLSPLSLEEALRYISGTETQSAVAETVSCPGGVCEI